MIKGIFLVVNGSPSTFRLSSYNFRGEKSLTELRDIIHRIIESQTHGKVILANSAEAEACIICLSQE